MTAATDDVVLELRALRTEVAAVAANVEQALAQLAALTDNRDDPRAQPFAVAALAFAGRGVWSAGELDADARRQPRRKENAALVAALAPIVGDSPANDRAVRLGKWLASRRTQIRTPEARLVRVKKAGGAWLWAFELPVR